MSLFFLVFFALYGGMHAYAFFRTRSALALGPLPALAVGAFMLLMTLSPFFIRLLERHEWEHSARVLSYLAYLWMAVLFLWFCSSLVLDLVNLFVRAAAAAGGRSWILFPGSLSFLVSAGIAVLLTVSGYLSALDIKTERLTIRTPKLPAGVDRLKIVQISDVHLGLIVREERLKKILSLVNAEKPDVFVSTGDLVDAQINHMAGMAELLRGVNARYGKYAVTGNHEYYAGIEAALAFTRNAGFILLRGTAVKNGLINIAGVDDPTGMQLGEKPEPEMPLLSVLPKDRFTLLLKHRPVVDPDASALFDLQLSGHTHKGQIYPFTYVSALAYPMNSGRFDLPAGSILRVSRGTGTWGPPVRFLSPPEITVVELIRDSSKKK